MRRSPPPPDLQAQLRLQDEAAHAIRAGRIKQGALEFHRIEADPVVVDGQVHEIKAVQHNRATDLIEDFMVAANETMAELLHAGGRSCIRRVVRSPERWSRIVELVARYGTQLPAEADSAALSEFLRQGARSRRRSLSGYRARHHQADGRRRVCRREGKRHRTARPLRTGRARLHPFHRAQPPLRRSRQPAHGQSNARQPALALHR